MKLKYLLFFTLCSNTYATVLDFKPPTYRIEFNTKTEKVKILSKEKATKICDEAIKKRETIEFFKSTIKRSKQTKNSKVYLTHTCYL